MKGHAMRYLGSQIVIALILGACSVLFCHRWGLPITASLFLTGILVATFMLGVDVGESKGNDYAQQVPHPDE